MQARISARARGAAPIITNEWASAVRDHAAAHLQADLLERLGVDDCKKLAAVAAQLLRGEQSVLNRSLIGLFLGRSAVEQLIDSVLSSGTPLDDDRIAAGRALQVIGIALCAESGVEMVECPCFAEPAGYELADVLFLLLRLAVGDWTGLADVAFLPLASP